MSKMVLLDADSCFSRDLARNLRSRGLEVEYFPSFMEFALGSREFGPEVFVLDVSASEAEGASGPFGDVLNPKKLRSLFGRSLKIWVLARHDGPDISAECQQAGADLVLYKGPTVDDTAVDIAFAWRSLSPSWFGRAMLAPRKTAERQSEARR